MVVFSRSCPCGLRQEEEILQKVSSIVLINGFFSLFYALVVIIMIRMIINCLDGRLGFRCCCGGWHSEREGCSNRPRLRPLPTWEMI